MRRLHVADVGDAAVGLAALQDELRRRHAPAHHRQLALAVGVTHHRRGVIGKDAGMRRQIAGDVAHPPRELADFEQIGEAEPATEYPRVEGEHRAPPEDVSGLPGFELFLVTIADPDREEHDDLMRWSGGSFDPKTLDADAVQKRVAKLARRRTIGKAAFATSRNRIN